MRREGSAAFLGIPFVEPPTGNLCLVALVAPAPWPGVHNVHYDAAGQATGRGHRDPGAFTVNVPAPRPILCSGLVVGATFERRA